VDYNCYGVNADTVKLVPVESMQFGKANERIWQTIMSANPKFGPLHMYKIDISDAFYRVPLSTSGVPKLGVCLPPSTDYLLWLPSRWSCQ
jgi:hypothetical protein